MDNSNELAEMIAEFFEGKVKKIRDVLVTAQQGLDDQLPHEDRQIPKLKT